MKPAGEPDLRDLGNGTELITLGDYMRSIRGEERRPASPVGTVLLFSQ